MMLRKCPLEKIKQADMLVFRFFLGGLCVLILKPIGVFGRF